MRKVSKVKVSFIPLIVRVLETVPETLKGFGQINETGKIETVQTMTLMGSVKLLIKVLGI